MITQPGVAVNEFELLTLDCLHMVARCGILHKALTECTYIHTMDSLPRA